MWSLQVARFHDVWIITRSNNRAAIEAFLSDDLLPNVHWVYYDLPGWARRWKKKQRGVHLYYFLWQIGVYFLGRSLHRQISFDIVHHVTFGQYWVPSFLGLLPSSFVWGPVGGGESAPVSFWRDFSLRGQLFEVIRECARSSSLLNPVMRAIARRSRTAIATTEQTAVRLHDLGAGDVKVCPQFAMTRGEMRYFADFPIRRSGPFRVISMGRLIHWKGFHLSLRAFAEFLPTHPDSEYWIVSDGPEGETLKELARHLGVQTNVVFWGRLPTLEDVYDKLAQCDVLMHPALHEAFGNACLEALAAGRPVVCLDWGGPALQVTAETGFTVPATDPVQAVHDMAAALKQLASDIELRVRMAQSARQRVEEHFDWQERGEWMNAVYHKAAGCQMNVATHAPVTIGATGTVER